MKAEYRGILTLLTSGPSPSCDGKKSPGLSKPTTVSSKAIPDPVPLCASWALKPLKQLQSEMMNSNIAEWEAEKEGKNTANKLQQYQPSYYRYPVPTDLQVLYITPYPLSITNTSWSTRAVWYSWHLQGMLGKAELIIIHSKRIQVGWELWETWTKYNSNIPFRRDMNQYSGEKNYLK